MCYPKPGPRCSGHIKKELKAVTAELAKDPTNRELHVKMTELNEQYKTSPAYIKAQKLAGNLKDAEDAQAERDKLIAAYHESVAAKGASKKIVSVVKEAQEDAEVYPAFKRQWIGKSFTDDDLVGSAIDDAPTVRNYSAEVDYELDEENDRILITAKWSESDDEGPRLGMNYYEVNDLDEDHRPTDEEAKEIAEGLNRDYNDNLGRDAWEEDLSEERAAWRSSVVDGVVANIGQDSEVSEQLRSHIVFKETYVPYNGFTAEYVQETWDSLYGD